MAGSRIPGPAGSTDSTIQTADGELRPGQGDFGIPGPIATQGQPKQGGGSGGASGNLVITLIGKFDNPWPNATDEAKAIDKGIWEPATDTFDAVASHSNNKIDLNNLFVCDSFSQFLGAIQNASKKIARINVISHSNPGVICFSGSIDASTGQVTLKVNANPGDLDALDGAALKHPDNAPTIEGLRSKFASGAEMIFYTCNSGLNLALLKDIADAFQVTARGFAQEIQYCVEWNGSPPVITRTFTNYLNPVPADKTKRCEGKQRGFIHLKPDRSASP